MVQDLKEEEGNPRPFRHMGATERNYNVRGGIGPTADNIAVAMNAAIAHGSLRWHLAKHHDATGGGSSMVGGDMLNAVTPSGGRPEALGLLAAYLNAQTVREFRWLICDDCDPATPVPRMRDGIEVEVIRPSWRWSEGTNTQAQSLTVLLEHCDGPVVHLEDDDLYLSNHLATMTAALAKADLVGQRVSHYWNAATRRYKAIPGTFHASLGTTAMKCDAVRALKEICANQQTRLDIELWRVFAGRKQLLETVTAVGIKGLPGRPGIGIGHHPSFGDSDADGATLTSLVGEYAQRYV